jgi:hypothetical protein
LFNIVANVLSRLHTGDTLNSTLSSSMADMQHSINGHFSQQPLPSSTWCCNPQFRLTVQKPTEVVLSVGQADPRVVHRGHVRKALRKSAIGLTVSGLNITV